MGAIRRKIDARVIDLPRAGNALIYREEIRHSWLRHGYCQRIFIAVSRSEARAYVRLRPDALRYARCGASVTRKKFRWPGFDL